MLYFRNTETGEIKAYLKKGTTIDLGPSFIEITELEAIAYVKPNPTDASISDGMIAKRNLALSDSDWTQARDSPLPPTTIAVWATYRQALRDINKQPGWPYVDLPVPPA